MEQPQIDPAEIARRTRAALAYANVDIKDAHDTTGISASTMARIVSPSKPRGATVEERAQIATGCGVPVWFMEQGYMASNGQDVRELLVQVQALTMARLNELAGIIRSLESTPLPEPPGLLPHGSSDGGPNPEMQRHDHPAPHEVERLPRVQSR